jgi:hypothetical protein
MNRKNVALFIPELVPEPLWGRSAYKMLGTKAIWKTHIRGDTLANSNNCCSVCHEKWDYDDRRSVATLVRFEIHCSNCDLVAHAGRAFKLGYGAIVISHLCAMNQCDIKHAAAILKEAMNVWMERSRKDWRIMVASSLVERYPELAALPEFVPPPIVY